MTDFEPRPHTSSLGYGAQSGATGLKVPDRAPAQTAKWKSRACANCEVPGRAHAQTAKCQIAGPRRLFVRPGQRPRVGPMFAASAVVGRVVAGLTVVALAGCAGQLQSTSPGNASAPQPSSVRPTSASPSPTSLSAPIEAATKTQQRPSKLLASDGKPRESRLTIPALHIKNLRVKPYRGSPDDARGTRIQNRGIAASPYGPDGGV